MKPSRLLLAATAMVASLALPAFAAVKPTTKSDEKPPIWQTVKPQLIGEVRRVARLDAERLLAERIYGVSLNSDTSVGDLVLESDQVRADLKTFIKGVAEIEKAEYLEDGSLQVVCAVKLRQVIETVSRTLKEKPGVGGTVTVEDIEKVERKNNDKTLEVMGNAAIPGSPGHRKILAKRAAEMDAYRNLAERLMGVQVTSTTSLRNLVLESDKIAARTAQILRGAKPTKIEYDNRDVCEVTMEVKVAEIFEVARHYAKKLADDPTLVEYERKTETEIFSENGYGAPRDENDTDFSSSLSKRMMDARKGGEKKISAEAEKVVRKLGTGVVLD